MEQPTENAGASTTTGTLGTFVQKTVKNYANTWAIIAFAEFAVIMILAFS